MCLLFYYVGDGQLNKACEYLVNYKKLHIISSISFRYLKQ